ncbi:MAG TPA: 50S ribosomal protein L6 [Pirellulales bacterium]|nr:50S ribosomal protein L6 [Pirellulales bacterium]|tara:strand:- start:108 stop:650 length:543 start_codon:yes stop_codon:yes gene_type:complete
MSRIGNQPIVIPSGVNVSIDGSLISVEGPLGKLSYSHRPEITAVIDDGKQILIQRSNDNKESRAYHGLTRALVQNMVEGVTKGYEKKLEIVGVGYLAAIQEQTLQLRVGFANEVHKAIPQGLDVSCPDQTHVHIKGVDKQKVGQFAAEVRAVRKPEPYKGKGIRYVDEYVRRKAGKAVGA